MHEIKKIYKEIDNLEFLIEKLNKQAKSKKNR